MEDIAENKLSTDAEISSTTAASEEVLFDRLSIPKDISFEALFIACILSFNWKLNY